MEGRWEKPGKRRSLRCSCRVKSCAFNLLGFDAHIGSRPGKAGTRILQAGSWDRDWLCTREHCTIYCLSLALSIMLHSDIDMGAEKRECAR